MKPQWVNCMDITIRPSLHQLTLLSYQGEVGQELVLRVALSNAVHHVFISLYEQPGTAQETQRGGDQVHRLVSVVMQRWSNCTSIPNGDLSLSQVLAQAPAPAPPSWLHSTSHLQSLSPSPSFSTFPVSPLIPFRFSIPYCI